MSPTYPPLSPPLQEKRQKCIHTISKTLTRWGMFGWSLISEVLVWLPCCHNWVTLSQINRPKNPKLLKYLSKSGSKRDCIITGLDLSQRNLCSQKSSSSCWEMWSIHSNTVPVVCCLESWSRRIFESFSVRAYLVFRYQKGKKAIYIGCDFIKALMHRFLPWQYISLCSAYFLALQGVEEMGIIGTKPANRATPCKSCRIGHPVSF